PCKGFSRIGRAKIASLREQGVHGWVNRQYGDDRNTLIHKYLLVVEALRPDVFVFENVRHFESRLKTEGASYTPADALTAAIEELSGRGVAYDIATSVLAAHEHGCPQYRERFFLAAVRRPLSAVAGCGPSDILAVEQNGQEVPLLAALLGLGAPGTFQF